jgi:hypothetical protein
MVTEATMNAHNYILPLKRLQQSFRDIHGFKYYLVANISTLQQQVLPAGDSARHHGQYSHLRFVHATDLGRFICSWSLIKQH